MGSYGFGEEAEIWSCRTGLWGEVCLMDGWSKSTSISSSSTWRRKRFRKDGVDSGRVMRGWISVVASG